MKKALLIFYLIFSLNLFATYPSLNIQKNKKIFFIFTSEFQYEISSNDKECISIDKKYSKGKHIEQKAVYIKSLNYPKCKNKDLKMIISYNNTEQLKIPIILNSDKNTEIRNIPDNINIMFTPSGIMILEILKNPYKDINTTKIIPKINSDNSKYKITFPWLCLEYCGGNPQNEIAEFERNKDALTSVSYERYTMDGGNWLTLNMTNPISQIHSNDLTAWPMIRSDSRTYNEDEMIANLNDIWNNREIIAQQMINEAVTNNYAGYCMDIEFQTTRDTTKNKYMQIINYFARILHSNGKKLMIAHAHWATMAPMTDLKNTEADYVATMDPYTASELFFRKNGDETQGQAYEDYHQIEHNRLIWAFAWEYHVKSTQEAMWNWLQTNGYNENVAGAAVWRAPAENSCKRGCNPSSEGINYYEAFRYYYPIDTQMNTLCANVTCSNHGFCEVMDNQAVCNCQEGYHDVGLNCIKDSETCTEEITCSNHGICDDSEGIVKCNCDEGYINAGYECIKNTVIKKKIIKTVKSNSFKLYGALPYFHNDNKGLNDFSFWCYDNSDNENKYSLTFYGPERGKYRIYTFIPASNNLANKAIYTIKNGTEIKTAQINQITNKGNWGYLGEYDINEILEINLNCNNPNSNEESYEKIYFSAIKLELTEE